MEAYWSFHAQQNGIFLDERRKKAYLEFLGSRLDRKGREKREKEKEEDLERCLDVLGRTGEERFRVYCSWGKGKRWLEGVRERKLNRAKTEVGVGVGKEEEKKKVASKKVVGRRMVTQSELNATRVKFFAAREEVRRENVVLYKERINRLASEAASAARGGGVKKREKELLAARLFAAKEEARRIQEELEKELDWDGEKETMAAETKQEELASEISSSSSSISSVSSRFDSGS